MTMSRVGPYIRAHGCEPFSLVLFGRRACWKNVRTHSGRVVVGTTGKRSGLDGKKLWANSLVGMRREEELKIL